MKEPAAVSTAGSDYMLHNAADLFVLVWEVVFIFLFIYLSILLYENVLIWGSNSAIKSDSECQHVSKSSNIISGQVAPIPFLYYPRETYTGNNPSISWPFKCIPSKITFKVKRKF